MGGVDPAGMVGLQLLHKAGNAVFAGGFDQEVDVVRHQAKGMEADMVTPGEDVNAIEVGDELVVGVEHVLLVVAALVDVVDLAALPIAESGVRILSFFGLHANKWVSRGKILIYF